MLNGLMQSNMLKGADAADDSGYDADGDDGADNYDDDECDDAAGDENGGDDELVIITMTMMLRRMLTVILGMKMHEYDNDDPECKIDADRCWRYHRYRDNPPVCLPLIGATDLGSTRLALQWHAVGAHLTAAKHINTCG